MHILLFGKNGQVGWELQRALAPLGHITAVDFDSTDYCGDFSNSAGVAETVRLVKPDVIVNAAAHTAVDKAESEREFAELLNATSVAVIAKEAEALGAWLVHYSTDYVFDGSGERPWVETDVISRSTSMAKPSWQGNTVRHSAHVTLSFVPVGFMLRAVPTSPKLCCVLAKSVARYRSLMISLALQLELSCWPIVPPMQSELRRANPRWPACTIWLPPVLPLGLTTPGWCLTKPETQELNWRSHSLMRCRQAPFRPRRNVLIIPDLILKNSSVHLIWFCRTGQSVLSGC